MQGTGKCWHGWVGLLLCFGPRSQTIICLLETVSFGDFDNGARCFFDKQFYFFTKHVWSPVSQNVVSIEQFLCLQLPKLPFPESPLPQRASSPAISHPTRDPLIFWFSPTHPTAKSLSKALQAQSVSQEMTQSSCDLYQAIPYAVPSAASGLLLLLIADDYARLLSKISGDTSTGSHLWTWHIMTKCCNTEPTRLFEKINYE